MQESIIVVIHRRLKLQDFDFIVEKNK